MCNNLCLQGIHWISVHLNFFFLMLFMMFFKIKIYLKYLETFFITIVYFFFKNGEIK